MSDATGAYQKRFRDLAGLYADEAAFSAMQETWNDTVVYEVSEFRPNERTGDLIFGVTRMLPGKVGEEYFVTRGHIHKQSDRPEIYYGQKGRGLMLLESPEGEVRVVAVDAQIDDGRGGWKQIDNPNWRMRDAATVAALYGREKKEENA